jgi:hypothetical protein
MANSLSAVGQPAPPPENLQGGNVLSGQPSAAPTGAPANQPPPQVTHQQAVCALRHFSAISRELEVFLKDPDLGRSDIKSKIIDGTTKLVASRIITPGQAVEQLSNVPSDPLLQRKWVQEHFQQTMLAMNVVLDHHAQAEPGSGDAATEIARSQSKPDSHLEDMQALTAHYRKGVK